MEAESQRQRQRRRQRLQHCVADHVERPHKKRHAPARSMASVQPQRVLPPPPPRLAVQSSAPPGAADSQEDLSLRRTLSVSSPPPAPPPPPLKSPKLLTAPPAPPPRVSVVASAPESMACGRPSLATAIRGRFASRGRSRGGAATQRQQHQRSGSGSVPSCEDEDSGFKMARQARAVQGIYALEVLSEQALGCALPTHQLQRQYQHWARVWKPRGVAFQSVLCRTR